MTKKADKKVYLLLGLMFVAVVIAVALNRGDPELRRALEENREFLIHMDGETIATVSLQDLLDLEPEVFTTTMSTSISKPRQVELEGVELRVVLEEQGIDTTDATGFIFAGYDRYYSPLTLKEVEKPGFIYVCLKMDGEVLKPQSEGGMGPFLMVTRDTPFAQRWCKYVESVEIRK